MLTCLRVRQLAIIDEVEVEFGPGLNVVTGETGAGKSILVNAMKLVLGERGRPDLIRSGADKLEVEALFDLEGAPEIRTRLQKLEIEAEEELLVRRTVDSSGRSRAYLNGRLVPIGQLAGVVSGLVDICSQHEHHSLVDPSCHLGYLDAFAGLDSDRGKMGAAFAAMTRAKAALNEAERALKEREAREDLIRFQLGEIEKLDPKPGEEQELSAELDRLRHAADLYEGTREAEELLYAGDDAICTRLSRVVSEIQGLCRFDPALDTLLGQLETARTELDDVARQVRRYSERVRVDPERLARGEERLHSLRRMLRKYGGSSEELLKQREEFKRELEGLEHAESSRDELDKLFQEAARVARTLAQELSAVRVRFAEKLGGSITGELQTLGMGDARVQVEVATDQAGSLLPTGMDKVEFLIATNRGEEPRALRKVASGGELSRALLALKRTLAGLGPAGLYVFDEVDSGVGGAIAEVIAQKLREVSIHSQVLCITHLPQIAAYGNQHFHVRKGVVEGRTRSGIYRLSEEERMVEVSRMLGGLKVSDKARHVAEEMLKDAREQS